MLQFVNRLTLTLGLFICVFAITFAHEGREVGDYVMEFGWREEPAYAGMINGPEVYVEHHDTGDFPAEVEVDLRAEVTFGSESKTVLLEEGEETGHFTATLIPTLPGDYTFRIFGTIGDVEVDETFNSADGEFSTVEPASDVMFPSVPDTAELLQRIEALEARLAELEAE